MSMTRLLYGFAALPLLAGVAFGQTPNQSIDSKALVREPMQLNEKQMDKVTAGWALQETDLSNTSSTWVSIYERRAAPAAGTTPVFNTGNNILCAGCYLLINTPSFSVGSAFGPAGTPGIPN